MWLQSRNIFLATAGSLVLFAAVASASDHHSLNGTWKLAPTQSEFNGQPAIQTGMVTINDRQHNIYISRNFNYEGANQSFEYTFSVDGRENSSVREGKAFKTKAKWDDNVLKVKTTQNDTVMTESYSLAPDGTMLLLVERPGHPVLTLRFHRQ